MLNSTIKQRIEVIRIVSGERYECVCSDTPPAFPQRINVLEKAIMQKGHLGSTIKRMVLNNPVGFFIPKTGFPLLHGLQSSCVLASVVM